MSFISIYYSNLLVNPKQKGGDLGLSTTVKTDTRNILSKIVGSKKYMVASIVSAILVAVVNSYDLAIAPAVIAKIVALLFGTAVVMNGVEDAAEKLKG